MNIQERSIAGGKSFRPKSMTFKLENPQALVIVTPWGENNSAEKVGSSIVDTLQSFTANENQKSSSESANMVDMAQRLKVGMALANDYLVLNDNKTEWKTVCEVSAISVYAGTLHWASVGQPFILMRSAQGVSVLSAPVEQGAHLGISVPLPNGIGLERGLQVQVGSLWLPENYQILFLSSSYLPSTLLQNTEWTVPTLVDLFANEKVSTPIWFGLVNP